MRAHVMCVHLFFGVGGSSPAPARCSRRKRADAGPVPPSVSRWPLLRLDPTSTPSLPAPFTPGQRWLLLLQRRAARAPGGSGARGDGREGAAHHRWARVGGVRWGGVLGGCWGGGGVKRWGGALFPILTSGIWGDCLPQRRCGRAPGCRSPGATPSAAIGASHTHTHTLTHTQTSPPSSTTPPKK